MRTFESKDRCCDRVDIYYIYEAQSLDNRRVFWFVRRIMAAYSDSVLDNILVYDTSVYQNTNYSFRNI